jgi:hypothetical protein
MELPCGRSGELSVGARLDTRVAGRPPSSRRARPGRVRRQGQEPQVPAELLLRRFRQPASARKARANPPEGVAALPLVRLVLAGAARGTPTRLAATHWGDRLCALPRRALGSACQERRPNCVPASFAASASCRGQYARFGKGEGQDVEAVDTVEVPHVGFPDAPPGGDGRRSEEPVVRTDILARGGKLGPDAGVRTSSEQAERQRWKRGQDCLDNRFAASAVSPREDLNSHQPGHIGQRPAALNPALTRRYTVSPCERAASGKHPDSCALVARCTRSGTPRQRVGGQADLPVGSHGQDTLAVTEHDRTAWAMRRDAAAECRIRVLGRGPVGRGHPLEVACSGPGD